ncbi:hypothetical protein GT370_14355 [Acidocella sp. MX-AZ03]|uniref:hypothetical protein n=1 Tax=Acidocella sp. MX-AZ03 TaxID=2697363 RepID=UPI0022DDCB95|nr:hypothetical protein [Acidocella sp. MX-AZ03]WBO58376.1 hypothetical protein GT370_14355 [Acidocella sp. MX-AZ03]
MNPRACPRAAAFARCGAERPVFRRGQCRGRHPPGGNARRPKLPLSTWFGADAKTLIHDRAALAARLDHDIARLDAMIAAQLDEILHHPGCAGWRGAGAASPGWPPACRSPAG